MIGLKDDFLHDTGAFIPYGIAVAQVGSTSIAGPYRIPNFRITFRPIYLPTVQVTPYRGCGRPHACYAIERAMDQLADDLGLDRLEVRRRNFIAASEFPYIREGVIFADGPPGQLRQRRLREGPRSGEPGDRHRGLPRAAGGGAQGRALSRRRARLLCRGHRAGAVRGRPCQDPSDHRQGLRHHGPDQPGSGPRDRVRTDRRRPDRRPCRGRDRGRRRYRRLRMGRGDVCEPCRGMQRQRHPQGGGEGPRADHRKRPPTCWNAPRRTSNCATARPGWSAPTVR